MGRRNEVKIANAPNDASACRAYNRARAPQRQWSTEIKIRLGVYWTSCIVGDDAQERFQQVGVSVRPILSRVPPAASVTYEPYVGIHQRCHGIQVGVGTFTNLRL